MAVCDLLPLLRLLISRCLHSWIALLRLSYDGIQTLSRTKRLLDTALRQTGGSPVGHTNSVHQNAGQINPKSSGRCRIGVHTVCLAKAWGSGERGGGREREREREGGREGGRERRRQRQHGRRSGRSCASPFRYCYRQCCGGATVAEEAVLARTRIPCRSV